MVVDDLSLKFYWSLRLGETNEFSRNDAALVHQLVEAVLTVGTWLTKNDGASLDASFKSNSISSH